MASLSPVAMRLTRLTSDEFSPAAAAIAGEAALADPGLFNALNMENPLYSRPALKKLRSCGRFLIFFL
jgi:hypothetical protein